MRGRVNIAKTLHKETHRDNAMLTALNDADWELVRFYLAPIQPLIDADEVTNIMVNRYDDIWADDLDKGMYKTNLSFQDDAAVAALIEQIANALSQCFDPVKTPIVNARLPDGSRVCATLPAATPQGCTLSIRLHRRRDLDLQGLERARAINADIRRFLLAAIERGDNLLVSGATNSGKTTLLNALSHAIPPPGPGGGLRGCGGAQPACAQRRANGSATAGRRRAGHLGETLGDLLEATAGPDHRRRNQGAGRR